MANTFVGIFLLLFGLNLVFGLSIPSWATGLLAIIAGALLLMERFSIRLGRKK